MVGVIIALAKKLFMFVQNNICITDRYQISNFLLPSLAFSTPVISNAAFWGTVVEASCYTTEESCASMYLCEILLRPSFSWSAL